MPTANINLLYCVHEATGVDLDVLTSLLQALPTQMLASEFQVPFLVDAVKAIPSVIQAISIARADPDDLFITTKTSGNLKNSIFPVGADKTVDMQAGQSLTPKLSIPFTRALN